MKKLRGWMTSLPFTLLLLGALVGCKSGDKKSDGAAATADSTQQAAGRTAPGSPAPGSPAPPGMPGSQAPGQPGAAAVPLTPSGPPDQVVAKVNGTTITRGELDFAIRRITTQQERQVPPERHAEIRKSILDELVDQELLFEKATASNVKVSEEEFAEQWKKVRAGFPDDKAFAAQLAKDGLKQEQAESNVRRRLVIMKYLRSTVFDQVKVAPEEEAKFYADNKERIAKHPDQVRASHILRLVKKGASQAEKDAAKVKINEALARAKKGEDFAALVKEYSEDGSKARGGDVGFFGKTDMVEPFEKAAWALKPGEISAPVQSQFGYHIIERLPYSEAKEEYVAKMSRGAGVAAESTYFARLDSSAEPCGPRRRSTFPCNSQPMSARQSSRERILRY